MNLNYALNLFGLQSLEYIDESKLKLAYIRLAKTKHPDKSGSHEEFVALKEAHEILIETLKKKKSNLPSFLQSNENTSLSQTNYAVLRDQYELIEETKLSVNDLIGRMQSRKKQIELEGVEELKSIEKEIDANLWFRLAKTFLNKYPQSYYDRKTALRVKSQNMKSAVDKQVFKEIIGEYAKTMDMMTLNLSMIDLEKENNENVIDLN